MEYYAGCNHWVDHEGEKLLGTATSMHDCGDCEQLNICNLKKETEVWKYNEDIKRYMNNE